MHQCKKISAMVIEVEKIAWICKVERDYIFKFLEDKFESYFYQVHTWKVSFWRGMWRAFKDFLDICYP